MSDMYNNLPVIGVRLQPEGVTMFQNKPVIGIKEAADGVTFITGERVCGIDVLDADKAIHNDQPVLGAVLITDNRKLYNNQPVIPFNVVTGSIGLTTDENVTAINATGWDATYTSPPTFDPVADPKYLVVDRPGFNASGGSTTHRDNLIITQRVRQPYPNEASLSTDRVALSEGVYSTDTIVGGSVTNNSAFTSPKPVANWGTLHRSVVGDTLELEVITFHVNGRAGKPVACVVFSATDGTTTVTQTVAAMTVSTHPGDKCPVLVYKASLDISSLANPSTVTANAKVYPWIGGAAAVLDSADQSALREFSPRTFRRSTSLLANPPVAYVQKAANGGNDGTGVASTNAATAAASPFETFSAAWTAIHGLGAFDGAEIRIGDAGGVPFTGSVTFNTYSQSVANVTITRDPLVSQAAAGLSLSAFRPRVPYVRFKDLSLVRGGTTLVNGEAGGAYFQLENISLDNASYATPLSTTANTRIDIDGATVTNAGSSMIYSGTVDFNMLRGFQQTAGSIILPQWFTVGCVFTNISSWNSGGRTIDGSILAFNRCINHPNTGQYNIAASVDVSGVAVVQNLVEYIDTTTNPPLRVTPDAATGDVDNVIIWNNTCVGAYQAGRWNVFYDEGATRRTSTRISVKGNIVAAIYTKSDVFQNDGTAVGNWWFMYGANCAGNFTINQSNTPLGGNQAQAYPGLGSKIGTSQTVPQDPLFTDNQATTYNGSYTAGAGGGAYTLEEGSPAAGILASAVLPFDLAGNARPATNDAAGAYAAA